MPTVIIRNNPIARCCLSAGTFAVLVTSGLRAPVVVEVRAHYIYNYRDLGVKINSTLFAVIFAVNEKHLSYEKVQRSTSLLVSLRGHDK